MLRRDYRDVIAGAVLIALGLFAGLYSVLNYSVGTMVHMGPGMFPAGVGFLLAGIGFLMLLPALFRNGPPLPKPDVRALVAVLVGLLVFSVTVRPFGMVPAIVLLTIAAALADNKLGIIGTLGLAAVLCVIALLIFRLGLEIPLQPFNWPFR